MVFLLPQVLVSLLSHASTERIRLSALDVGISETKDQNVRKWILDDRLWRYRNVSSLTPLALRNISPGMVFLLPQVLVSLVSHTSNECICWSAWDVETPKNKVKNVRKRNDSNLGTPKSKVQECLRIASLELSNRVHILRENRPERFPRNQPPPPSSSRVVVTIPIDLKCFEHRNTQVQGSRMFENR
ncbi:hypothetical protein GALMADRAFT_217224 [Galerina marginata CBS 339.88]|uniref:Secreted protein n=1 Tax=Galerina marginata (strain CBS 339.88) TaxID=685588 RepID=A0A067S7V2_GALM3|nr:hypothetical protein GALMADRAFT_217224 [Galerina marginata CBS 339.88]